MRKPLLGVSVLVTGVLFLAGGCAIFPTEMGFRASEVGLMTPESSPTNHLTSIAGPPVTECELWEVKRGVVRPTTGCVIDLRPARPTLAHDLFKPTPFGDATCPSAMAGSC